MPALSLQIFFRLLFSNYLIINVYTLVLQKRLYCVAKAPVLRGKSGFFALQYSAFRIQNNRYGFSVKVFHVCKAIKMVKRAGGYGRISKVWARIVRLYF